MAHFGGPIFFPGRGRPTEEPALKRLAPLLLILTVALTAFIWAGLRLKIESGLATAAQRDLQTIADLVAVELESRAAAAPLLKGLPLARQVGRADSELGRALRRADDEAHRRIGFFDASGRQADAGDGLASAQSKLLQQALAARLATPPVVSGGLSEAYPDAEGRDVIGAWRWLPRLQLGISVERPYQRFAEPLVWVDTAFAVVLAALVVLAMASGLPSPAAVLAAFRGPDIRRCGAYDIERLLGEGTMSNVYLARHRHLGRVVALKRLKVQAQNDELSARFDRELRLASRLSHPNIVTVLDHGRDPQGGYFYTMEFVRGLTLAQWVQQHGPLPPARAVRLLRQICDAVGAMHDAGLLHRDIKPDNVMACAAHGDWDLVKLLDFGLIKNLESDATRDLTRNVRVLGTPAYMAPERLSDPRSIDPRTDLYGIGCIAFLLLTGRKPFEARADADLAQQVLHVAAARVAKLSPFPIPPALDALVAAALAKTPAERPADAASFAAALDAIAEEIPWRAELARLWWQSLFPPPPSGHEEK